MCGSLDEIHAVFSFGEVLQCKFHNRTINYASSHNPPNFTLLQDERQESFQVDDYALCVDPPQPFMDIPLQPTLATSTKLCGNHPGRHALWCFFQSSGKVLACSYVCCILEIAPSISIGALGSCNGRWAMDPSVSVFELHHIQVCTYFPFQLIA